MRFSFKGLPCVCLACILLCLTAACAQEAGAEREDLKDAPLTQGVNHIGLTVTDLEASTGFFIETLGWKAAGGDPEYPANFVTDGDLFLTLWQATDPAAATGFNRKTNVGLHHLALTVADVETLDALHETFKGDPRIRIAFGPELSYGGPTVHMMVYEPSGIRIEFAVPGGRKRGQ